MSNFLLQIGQSVSYVSSVYNSHPLSVSSAFTILFTTAATTALILEAGQRCNPDLQLWLGVMTVYGFVRWILRLALEAVTLEYVSYSGNISVIYKLIEMVDIFGMVWFSVGNLLVFNGTKCSDSSNTPMTFWVCLIYIIVGYLSLVFPMLLRMCLSNHTPVIPNERNNMLSDTGTEGGQARNEMWRRWLANYGCVLTTYDTLRTDTVHNIPANSGSTGGGTEDPAERDRAKSRADAPLVSNCPICLVDFEDSSEIINYPCTARMHYFHANCMYDWLKVSSRRGFDNITCPCCRESPVMPGVAQRRRSFRLPVNSAPQPQSLPPPIGPPPTGIIIAPTGSPPPAVAASNTTVASVPYFSSGGNASIHP